MRIMSKIIFAVSRNGNDLTAPITGPGVSAVQKPTKDHVRTPTAVLSHISHHAVWVCLLSSEQQAVGQASDIRRSTTGDRRRPTRRGTPLRLSGIDSRSVSICVSAVGGGISETFGCRRPAGFPTSDLSTDPAHDPVLLFELLRHLPYKFEPRRPAAVLQEPTESRGARVSMLLTDAT